MPEAFAIPLIAGLWGACLGSLTVTTSLRALKFEQALVGRSRCDHCAAPLSYAATVPVFSFIALRGACRQCRGAIDPVHLCGELAGLVVASIAFLLLEPPRAALVLAVTLVLIAASTIDLKTQRLPNRLNLVVAILGFLLAAQNGVPSLWQGLGAAILSLLTLGAVSWIFERFLRKPGLGFGDVKLLAGLALWLGLATPWVISLASLLGLVVVAAFRPANGRIAFGPLIAVSALVVGLAQDSGLLTNLGYAL
jgi:leader peptidase (prepilin peptidase)/N-methyltransferase